MSETLHHAGAADPQLPATASTAPAEGSGDPGPSQPRPSTTPDSPAEERFACGFAGCTRSYLKAAHLNRHMKTHDAAAAFECTECGKRFTRRDVLVRHAASVHSIQTRHRKQSCINCASQKLKCEGEPNETCRRCEQLKMQCIYKRRSPSIGGSGAPAKRPRSRSPSTARTSPTPFSYEDLPSATQSETTPILAPAIMPPPPHLAHSSASYSGQPPTFPTSRPSASHAHPSQVRSGLSGLPRADNAALEPTAVMSVAAVGTFMPSQDEQRIQPPSPLWQPQYNFSAERTSAALSNMAPFDFLPTITDPSIDVAASFDASLGWGLGDTELDLVGMFDLGTEPGSSASGPPQGVASGYETPSIDWLRLLGSAREPSTSSAAAAAATAATAGATADARADVPSVSSTAADASVGSTGAQVPPPFVHPAVPPARTPRSDPLAGISPQTALSTAEELSLATPSDGGGPEAPSITPWPHVYQPVAPVGPLSLPTVPNPPPPLVFEQPGATVTSQIREAMIELVQNSHISPWSGISLASFPSASVLSICLKLYLSRFHATFPILDPAALESASSSPLLLLSCAAVGAMYRADFEGLGVALTELVRRTTLWMREQDPRSSFELEVVQAWLLSSVSGLFCGSRKLYQHAEIARCGLVTAARRMELLRETPTCVEELLGRKLPSHLELAAAQREDELRLRLGWGIYHFDNLVASLLNLQPVISIAEVAESTYLPSETFMPDPTNRPRFRATIGTLLTKGSIDSPLTPFSTVVLQLTLYRLCIDAAYLDTVLAAAVPPARSGTYRLPFSPDVKHNPQELLDRIGSAWHASSVNVSSLHVVATALSYHAALQFSCGDFLSMAKICAGKYGAERARRARDWVRDKAVKDPVAVRRVLVRAVQLNALLVRHRFDTPAETIWLADSAMAVWAIIKFAGAILTEGPEAMSNSTAIKWNDVVASEPWIQRGGPLSLRSGLGEYGTATPGQVLRKFSEHLEDLPWGLSRKYRAVLLQLSQEEDLQEM